jgi:adenosylcobinamide-GDP ribazoletransferase
MPRFTFLADISACLRFYSRLPVPAPGEDDAHRMFDFSRAAAAVPVAGAIIGLVGALALIAARALGLPVLVAALLALASLAIVTGALHEDGLADCADSFGGAGRDEKLAIMRDSRIGTYGTIALILTFGLRATALAALMDRGLPGAAIAIVAVAALSRTLGLLPLAALAPARADGAGSAAGRPIGKPLARAMTIAIFIGYAPLIGNFGPLQILRVMVAVGAAILAATAVTKIARAAIGGQTGDVAGAAQQLAEIGYLCALAAAPQF